MTSSADTRVRSGTAASGTAAGGTAGSEAEGHAARQSSALYAEREKRISDAIALRKPDRVPVWSGVPGPYPAGRDGGFILGPSGQTEDVKIENVKAMVDCAKESGGAA